MHETQDGQHRGGRYLALLSLTALGVVYGDIGTSPLYAIRECFHGPHAIELTPANVFGVLSLIFWALIIVISIKYLLFVMRADNRGEGGILALSSLIVPMRGTLSRRATGLLLLGLFGAALLYGDSMITPAISVLSAVEGLEVATPLFEPYIVPITIAILIVLFLFQSRGTSGIGRVFGPVTLTWFIFLAVTGVLQIARNPGVVEALLPVHAVRFFLLNGWTGFWILGTVFLVVTGGEALYADMGHFGRKPIRIGWFAIVLPALLLQYFGQGALLLRDPAAAQHPFFHMGPDWALYPTVVLATVATIIASQAVISGAFSLTRQAVQLGYLPRIGIEHTSAREMGQIYIPAINWALMLACIGLVLGFQSASALANAYGVAVTTDMVFTTILFGVVAGRRWGWRPAVLLPLLTLFLVVDLSFWGANIIKVPHGGWFPLVVAFSIVIVMTTWKRGRQILGERLRTQSLPIDVFLEDVARSGPQRVPGTAVFMFGNPTGTPPALLHNFKHNKVLHERVVFLNVETEEIPVVPDDEKLSTEPLGHGFYRVRLCYGFMEDPDVPAALAQVKLDDRGFKMMETTFFLGRETLIASKRPGMAIWRERLFALMSRNAQRATAFFRLPPNRVVELGMQVEL